ncbi:MAG: hypothetical protein ABI645_06455 [Pseudomonadota bacterium]
MKAGIKVLAVTLGFLCACTRATMFGHMMKDDAVARDATTPVAVSGNASPAAQPAQALITRLIIDYTPTATKQTGNDARFNGAALRRTVADGLAAQGLLDLQNSAVIRVAAIEVDEFDIRATSNMVLMGRVASAGVLGATVRIRDGSSKELKQFHVRAEMPMKVVRNGTDKNALASLYKGFASQITDALTGRVRPPPAR